MSAKTEKLKRRQFRRDISAFAKTRIGMIINKKMRLNKIIIISQWVALIILAIIIILQAVSNA